jgi:hypothetical protein
MMATRAEVYAALDSERDYQDMRKVRDSGQEFHSVEEFLLYMKVYLDETIAISAHTWGPDAVPKTLEHLRKVTALGVACMEQHGAPHRVMP